MKYNLSISWNDLAQCMLWNNLCKFLFKSFFLIKWLIFKKRLIQMLNASVFRWTVNEDLIHVAIHWLRRLQCGRSREHPDQTTVPPYELRDSRHQHLAVLSLSFLTCKTGRMASQGRSNAKRHLREARSLQSRCSALRLRAGSPGASCACLTGNDTHSGEGEPVSGHYLGPSQH